MQLPSHLARYSFEKYVLKVTLATLKQGGTASRLNDYRLLPPLDAWQFPKYPARTVILPPDADLAEGLTEFICSNDSFLREPDCWLGTWINPQTQCVYLDVTTSSGSLDEAKKMALEFSCRAGRMIVALYNSGRKETVYL